MLQNLKIKLVLAWISVVTFLSKWIEKTQSNYVKTCIFLSPYLPIFTFGKFSNNQNRRQIHVLDAISISDQTEKNITNVLNLVLNWYWDDEMENGGISFFHLIQFFPHVSQIHILYRTNRFDSLEPSSNQNLMFFNSIQSLSIDLENEKTQNSTFTCQYGEKTDILFHFVDFVVC